MMNGLNDPNNNLEETITRLINDNENLKRQVNRQHADLPRQIGAKIGLQTTLYGGPPGQLYINGGGAWSFLTFNNLIFDSEAGRGASSGLMFKGSSLTFAGVGLDDFCIRSPQTADVPHDFDVRINLMNPNSFDWRLDGGAWTMAVAITGGNTPQALGATGVNISFGAAAGHTSGDMWSWTEPTGKLYAPIDGLYYASIAFNMHAASYPTNVYAGIWTNLGARRNAWTIERLFSNPETIHLSTLMNLSAGWSVIPGAYTNNAPNTDHMQAWGETYSIFSLFRI